MRVQLLGTTWDHPRGHDSVAAASKAYAAQFDVDIHWQVRSLQAFADESLAGLAARYDLMVIDHPHIPAAAEAGLLAALDGCGFDEELATLARQSVGPSHSSYTYRDRQYGLACDAAAQVSAHRPDQLTSPPREWAAVMELAKQGRVRWPGKPIDAYSTLISLAAAAGAPPMTKPGLFLDEQNLLATLDIMHELVASVPAEDLELDPIQVAEILCGDNRWCYSPLLFGYTNYSRAGYRRHQITYTDMPATDGRVEGSLLGGAGIAVSAASRSAQQAREFAFWLCSGPVQRGVYFRGGGQPGNSAAWSDPDLDTATSNFFSRTRRTLDGAYLRPRLPRYIAFQDRVSPWITQNLRNELSDTQLVGQLNDAAAELLPGESA